MMRGRHRRQRRNHAGATPGLKPVYKFGSVAELISVAINGKSDMPVAARSSRRNDVLDSGWHGATWKDAVTMGLNGDMDGARRLAPAVIDGLNQMIRNRARLDPVYSVEGGQWIDVARYVRGEPEAWGSMIESEPVQPTRRVAIVVNAAMPGDVKPAAIDKVGAQIGSAVLGLQAAGYTVTLYAAKKISGYSYGSILKIIAPVNPGGQPLDVARMSTILRPWFLRRLCFSFYETLPADVRATFGIENGGGYGGSEKLDHAEARELTGEPHTVVIDLGFEVRNPAGIREKIVSQIERGE